jgi:hypothetical protein
MRRRASVNSFAMPSSGDLLFRRARSCSPFCGTVAGMKSLEETLRQSRAARLSARRKRAESKSLRALSRAQGLVSRGLAKSSAELRAFVEADQLTMLLRAAARRHVTAPPTQGSQPARYESPGEAGNIEKPSSSLPEPP